MGHITKAEKSAHVVTIQWQSGGNFPDPPGGNSSHVTIFAEDSQRRAVAKKDNVLWSNGSGSVTVSQNTAAYARLGDNKGHSYTEDHLVATAAASQNSFFKERISISNSGSPQDGADHTDQRIFDLLVPEDNSIGHYVRGGVSGGWRRVDKLLLPVGQQVPDTSISHIQSFTSPEHLNALALLEPSLDLVLFEYNSDTGTHHPIPVIVEAGGFDSIPIVVQSDHCIPALVQTDQGLFHLLVPLRNQNGVQHVVHLVHTNQTIQGPWQQVATLPQLTEGEKVVSIALVQTDAFGSLKAVVRVNRTGNPSDGTDFLLSYQSDPKFRWQGPFPLPITNNASQDTIRNVAGSPGLVQSIFDDHEQLDLIVPIMDEQTRTVTLTHFTQPAGEETSIDHAWTQVATLLPLNDDPHTQVVSTSTIQDSNRNLQNIAHVITSDGQSLLAFYIFDPKRGWSAPTPFTNLLDLSIIVGDSVVSDDSRNDSGGAAAQDHDDSDQS